MRNPTRIDKFLPVIEEVWKRNPDLRFVQMILNVTEFYYMEDEEFLRRFEELYGFNEVPKRE